MKTRFTRIFLLLFILITLNHVPLQAQDSDRPMILPVAIEPGASSWLFGQAYGNTTGAYNFGEAWYSAGQGLHFGIDLAMPCGTPLVAVADGEVAFVDNLSFGSAPHNLILRHPALGLTSLYGHLLDTAPVVQGQTVQQGDIIGYSGDPDSTCVSRPHLHLEIRSANYRLTYNPIDYIDANWHSLASTAAFGYPLFQMNLQNARQWMSLNDQPNVEFGGRQLNNYTSVWPLPFELRPPTNPHMPLAHVPLLEETTWQLRQIGFNGCCPEHIFHPTNPDELWVIDGFAGQQATVGQWSATSGEQITLLYDAPLPVTSPDGTHYIYNDSATTRIVHTTTGTTYNVSTQGATLALNIDNTQLMWVVRAGAILPGANAPNSAVWLSNIDGTNMRQLFDLPGASAVWMDAHRLLVTIPQAGRITTVAVYDTRDDSSYELGTWRNVRALSVSPTGDYIMFMLMWQGENNTPDPNTDGVYVLQTADPTSLQRLDWFGGWQWRDNESVFYLPLNPSSPYHTLSYYHVPTDEDRALVTPEMLPFTIMNGDWDISADGRRIVFQNALDNNMWLLEMVETVAGTG